MDLRRRLALRLWQRAAEQGNAEASRKVGDYYYEGVPAASTAVVSPDAPNDLDAQPSQSATTQPPGNEPSEVPSSRPDFEAAADAYLVAAEARDPQAMFNIGYRRGSVLGIFSGCVILFVCFFSFCVMDYQVHVSKRSRSSTGFAFGQTILRHDVDSRS